MVFNMVKDYVKTEKEMEDTENGKKVKEFNGSKNQPMQFD